MYQIFTLHKQKLISWKKETWMYRNITTFSECWRHSKWENNLFHTVILLEISLDWATSTRLFPFTSAHSNVRKHETSCSDSHHRLCQEGCVMQSTPEKHMGQGKWSWERKLQVVGQHSCCLSCLISFYFEFIYLFCVYAQAMGKNKEFRGPLLPFSEFWGLNPCH